MGPRKKVTAFTPTAAASKPTRGASNLDSSTGNSSALNSSTLNSSAFRPPGLNTTAFALAGLDTTSSNIPGLPGLGSTSFNPPSRNAASSYLPGLNSSGLNTSGFNASTTNPSGINSSDPDPYKQHGYDFSALALPESGNADVTMGEPADQHVGSGRDTTWAEPTEASPVKPRKKKTKKADTQPDPTGPIKAGLDKYRIVYDEAVTGAALDASKLKIQDIDEGHEMHAAVQHAPLKPKGVNGAIIGKGVGIFMSHNARLSVPLHLRPSLNHSQSCTVNAQNGEVVKVIGTAYVSIIFREAMTGFNVVARLCVNVVDSTMKYDLFFGDQTPNTKLTGTVRNVVKNQMEFDVLFANEEALIVSGPL